MNLVWILDKGSEVTGAHILWCEHYEDTSAGIRDHMVESGCEETDTRWGFDFCEIPIPSGRWTEALRQLEGSELWSLPGDATRGMEDAPGLVVELRDGSSYRSYSYSDFDPAWSRDSGLAWQIVETMFSLKP